MRAFLAIDLPEIIRNSLTIKLDDLRRTLTTGGQNKAHRDSGIRWSRPEGIHLTLKFLGEVTDTQVEQIVAVLSTLEPIEKFLIEVKGFGFFPGPAHPRIFWAGVEAPPELARLAKRIELKMEELGFARENREYHPHLTLARFTHPLPEAILRPLAEEQNGLSMGRFEVSDFFLFESKSSPEGSKYGKVVRFPFIRTSLTDR
jgi:2'-5' RNA ligase